MSWDDNPYYNPEKWGLEKVAELDFSSGSYEFNLTSVWTKEGEESFYWADDSGCSCPSPFEDVRGVEELQRGGFKQLRDHLNSRYDDQYSLYVKLRDLHPVLEELKDISEDWQ